MKLLPAIQQPKVPNVWVGIVLPNTDSGQRKQTKTVFKFAIHLLINAQAEQKWEDDDPKSVHLNSGG